MVVQWRDLIRCSSRRDKYSSMKCQYGQKAAFRGSVRDMMASILFPMADDGMRSIGEIFGTLSGDRLGLEFA